MKRTMLVTTLIAAVVLGGCGTQGTGTTESPPSGTNRPTDSSDASADGETPSASAATAAPASANPKFGDTYTWKDGLAVTISAPTPYTPSDSAAVDTAAPAHLTFGVTIVNGTKKNFDQVLFNTSMQSGNVEAQQIFDNAGGLGGPPSTPLLPGRESVFKIGYSVQNPNDLVLQVRPSFEYEPVIYTS